MKREGRMARTAATDPPEPDAKAFHYLDSYADTLYEELEKLSKKSPTLEMSVMATGRVNRAISDARKMLERHDPYADQLKEFVEDGTHPEVRDAVLVLREVRAALYRLDQRFKLSEKYRRLSPHGGDY
jgi:hypothetical protein